MSDGTHISWADATWSVTRGCTHVSAGCLNCYAERMAHRFSGAGQPFEGLTKDGKWTGKVQLLPGALELPLHWKKPRRIFVDSMSDLFHPEVNEGFINMALGVISRCSQHTFLVLTKRAARMRSVMTVVPPIANLWLGVSIENQETADERIPILLDTPAAHRFVSLEPTLGPVDLEYPPGSNPLETCCSDLMCGCRGGPANPPLLHYLDWIIVGGESGPGARPCDVEWIRSIVQQCKTAGTSCFVKQLGAKPVADIEPLKMVLPRDWKQGRNPYQWPEDLRVQQFPTDLEGSEMTPELKPCPKKCVCRKRPPEEEKKG